MRGIELFMIFSVATFDLSIMSWREGTDLFIYLHRRTDFRKNCLIHLKLLPVYIIMAGNIRT